MEVSSINSWHTNKVFPADLFSILAKLLKLIVRQQKH